MNLPAVATTGIDAVLQTAVDRGEVPFAVGVAADTTGIVYEGAVGGPNGAGHQHLGGVGVDSVFRIASMTKIVSTVAALQLRERGELDLDTAVEVYCPDFAGVVVLAGFNRDGPVLRPPVSRATVRQLLTHTAGFGYPFWDAALLRWHAGSHRQQLPDGLRGLFAAPMVTDPGTRFSYGTATDWLGRVLEAISGQPLDILLDELVLGPLGLRSTGFRVADADRHKLVPVHRRGGNGDWIATDLEWDSAPEHWPAGHGLYSTPSDFLRFQRMLLSGGSLDGIRILTEKTVAEMFRSQLGRLAFPTRVTTAEPATSCDFVPGPGATWGWGLLLNNAAEPGLRAPGSGGWAGVFNTYFWIDPTSRLTGALYSQYAPFLDPGALGLYRAFERSMYGRNRL
ncbi:MAG: serine hydrolase domain-containing protein [Microlunatus sp.]